MLHRAARVRELAPGGLDAVFDNIGGPMTRVTYGLLAPGGNQRQSNPGTVTAWRTSIRDTPAQREKVHTKSFHLR